MHNMYYHTCIGFHMPALHVYMGQWDNKNEYSLFSPMHYNFSISLSILYI